MHYKCTFASAAVVRPEECPRTNFDEGERVEQDVHPVKSVRAARLDELAAQGGARDPRESAALLAVLEQWEFRPAMRQGKPVRIEILLAIPGE